MDGIGLGVRADAGIQPLIQFIAQIFALHYLRKHRSEIARPFRMWLYPIPSVIAFVGWAYIFLTSGWTFVGFGILTLVAGVLAYWLWTRVSPRDASPQTAL